jgi:hypothetical protein
MCLLVTDAVRAGRPVTSTQIGPPSDFLAEGVVGYMPVSTPQQLGTQSKTEESERDQFICDECSKTSAKSMDSCSACGGTFCELCLVDHECVDEQEHPITAG